MHIDTSHKNTLLATYRDFGLTILVGPFRSIIPSVAYLFLCPIIIKRSGVEVLGIWSLFGAISTSISIADVGFSQLLIREAGIDRSQNDNKRIYTDYIAAQRAYIALFFILVTILCFVRSDFLSSLKEIYSIPAIRKCIFFVILGTTIQLMAKLDAGILCARQDNYVVQVVTAIAPCFTYFTAILGAVLMHPIEGLSIGMVLSGIFMLLSYRRRISRHHNEWQSSRTFLPWMSTTSKIYDLACRGRHLYSISVGMLVRDPILRFVIAMVVGLQGVAVLDIAMRVTRMARQIVASGFTVLYPSFAHFNRRGYRENIIELSRLSLLIVFPVGVVFLGILIAAGDILFNLWLGKWPENLLPATQILAIWNAITLINIPFWFLLQASNHEREASISIWTHTASILLLVVFFKLMGPITLVDVLLYWTITAVLTQILIYFYVQAKLAVFWDIVLNPRVLMILGINSAFIISAFLINLGTHNNVWQTTYYLSIALTAFSTVNTFLIWKPLQHFFKITKFHTD